MSRLIMMMGIPGSGKSTYIKTHLSEFNNPIVVSRDEIRFSMLKPGEEYFSKEKEVFKKYIDTINTELANDRDIIADATHLNSTSRKGLLYNVSFTNIDKVIVIYINTSLEEALERNATRTGRELVPESAIKNMYNSLQIVNGEIERLINEYWVINEDGSEKKYLYNENRRRIK